MEPFGKEVIGVMETLIAKEVKRMAYDADVVIFALYDPNKSVATISDYTCYDRHQLGGPIELEVKYDYYGIGVWYIANRTGDHFTAKKVLLHIENGRFIHGQMGDVAGEWHEFPNYVTDDHWVSMQLAKKSANTRTA